MLATGLICEVAEPYNISVAVAILGGLLSRGPHCSKHISKVQRIIQSYLLSFGKQNHAICKPAIRNSAPVLEY